MNVLFGPLGKQYCHYFYFMSILSFIGFIIAAIFIVFRIIKEPKDILKFNFILESVAIIFYTLLPYFLQRLFYTMCVNSIN